MDKGKALDLKKSFNRKLKLEKAPLITFTNEIIKSTNAIKRVKVVFKSEKASYNFQSLQLLPISFDADYQTKMKAKTVNLKLSPTNCESNYTQSILNRDRSEYYKPNSTSLIFKRACLVKSPQQLNSSLLRSTINIRLSGKNNVEMIKSCLPLKLQKSSLVSQLPRVINTKTPFMKYFEGLAIKKNMIDSRKSLNKRQNLSFILSQDSIAISSTKPGSPVKSFCYYASCKSTNQSNTSNVSCDFNSSTTSKENHILSRHQCLKKL